MTSWWTCSLEEIGEGLLRGERLSRFGRGVPGLGNVFPGLTAEKTRFWGNDVGSVSCLLVGLQLASEMS